MRNKVRDLIRERGLTYEEVGQAIGISAQAVNEIVHGRTRGATARYALAAFLGSTVAELWPDEGRRAA